MTTSQIWILASVVISTLLVAALMYWPSNTGERNMANFLEPRVVEMTSENPVFTINSSGFSNSAIMGRVIFGFFFILFLAVPFLLRDKNIFSFSLFGALALSTALFFFFHELRNRSLPFQESGPIKIYVYEDYLSLPLPILLGLAQPDQRRAALEIYKDLQNKGGHIRILRSEISQFGYNPPTRLTALMGQLYIRISNPSIELTLGLPDLSEGDVLRLQQWKSQISK